MKKRLPLTLASVGAIALALGLLSTGEPARKPSVSAAGEAAPAAPPRPSRSRAATAPRAPRRGTPILPVHQLIEEAVAQEHDHTPSTVAEISESILEDDPELAEFQTLRGKALRTKDEKRRYQQMLADPARIEAAKEDLLAAVEAGAELVQENEVRRLMQLKYLTSSADWKQNPARDKALNAIMEVVLADLPQDLPSDQRGSVVGDKIDLYQHLLIGDPEQARAIKAEAAGTAVERVLAHAEKMLSSPVEAAQEAHLNSGG